MIVQGTRIAAAACFLPLSLNPAISNQLGTRHRAAIGVTEESDAVAVVVSEQTGAISLAVGGAIEAGPDAGTADRAARGAFPAVPADDRLPDGGFERARRRQGADGCASFAKSCFTIGA